MKKITALIYIKEKEEGLLSIAERRGKSLVPVLGGSRIIDYYLGPIVKSNFDKVLILTDRDMTKVRDYLVYTYGSGSFKILNVVDLFNEFMNVLRLKKNESLLIMRVDGLLFQENKDLKGRLKNLTDENYKVVVESDNLIGFYLNRSQLWQKLKLKSKGLSFKEDESKADKLWSFLEENISPLAKKLMLEGNYYSLKTVKDYYDLHFLWLRNPEKLKFQSYLLMPKDELKEKNTSRINSGGVVKNSYMAFSCSINGWVENSIIFSNVKIGNGAKVINSIIMDNNYIGDEAIIENVIICDNSELFAKISMNVGEGARIGENDNSGANGIFGDSIYGGVTLIGQNVEIPRGFKVARNCYIASEISKTLMRDVGRLKPGESLLKK